METLDAVIVAGDAPQEFLGKDVRRRMRLTVGGTPASLSFLRHYFRAGRDVETARTSWLGDAAPFLSLNGPYLSQYLQGRGLKTAVIPLLSRCREDIARLAAEGKPRAVVISTTFLPFAAHIDAMAAEIKKLDPRIVVVAGGIQVWKSYRHRLLLETGEITEDIRDAVAAHNYLMDRSRPSPVDVLVISASGENTLAELLTRMRRGEDYENLENTAHFRDGAWRINPIVPEPFAEVKMDWRRALTQPTSAYVPIQAGVGCGFRCTFCDFCGLRPVHVRTVPSVVEEIRTIPPSADGRRLFFTDDNLFVSKKRARSLCRAMIDADLSVRWRGMIRIAAVDDEIAALMKESGCTEILLGVESGDEDILKRMEKQVTPEEILAGVETLTRHGINTKSTFIVGFPGETDASIRNTVDLLNAYPTSGPAAHRYMFFTFAVLPLSGVASAASRAKYGIRGYGYDWTHETMTSEEAEARMEDIYDALKLELSPNYVLEVPDVPGMTVDGLKQAYLTRNKLARIQRGLPCDESEAELWTELEAAVSR